MEINKAIDYLSKNRSKWFYIFQFIFWFLHWISTLITNPSNQEFFFLHTLAFLPAIIISLILWHIYKKYNWIGFPWLKLVSLVIFSALICGIIWWYSTRLNAFLYFYIQFGKKQNISLRDFPMFIDIIWSYSYPFLAWSAIYFGYKFWEEWNKQKLKVEQEKALVKTAQLEMLHYQLNPHFLFNTLSSLRALIRIDSERAEEMITQISEFLRYSLLEGRQGEVPLSKEIEIMKHYLDIEKVRFKNKLLIEYHIDSLAEEYPVPVFLLHPLIENAIKHGMKSCLPPLKIFVSAEVNEGILKIEVENTGKWVEEQKNSDQDNTGTGLRNARKRLELVYPGNHSFDLVINKDSVRVIIKIKNELIKHD
jgi:hypothetical protein